MSLQSPMNSGLLVVNADDWGRDRETTGRTFDCIRRGSVSTVSAMVFMEDSRRAADVALEVGIDVGLHLNLTTPFSEQFCLPGLARRQQELAKYLRLHRFAPAVFNPGLVGCMEYVVNVQIDEFRKLYGREPERLDGHHHMHLCANVLFADLLPHKTLVRRNFSFEPGEKSLCNRLYRQAIDRLLARRHSITDFFFSLPPLQPEERLRKMFALAQRHIVEVETHPAKADEYNFLMGRGMSRLSSDVPTGTFRQMYKSAVATV